jgi:hypothetical protein
MTNSSRLLLAYTTASAKRPIYRRDTLNAVAIPAGWIISLSYSTRWIEPDLVKLVKSDRLAGSELLLVALRGSKADETPENAAPLRFCTVVKTELQERDLALVHVEAAGRPSERMAMGFLALASEGGWPVPIWQDTKRRPNHYLVQVQKERRASEPEASFDSHVMALRKCVEPEDCRYFKINRIYQFNPSNALRAPAVQISLSERQPETVGQTILVLRPGKLYNLEVLVHGDSLAEGGASPLELKIKGEQLEIAEPLLRQHGSAAIVSYLIAVKRQYASELATLLIRMSPTEGLPARPSAEAQVLLHIRPSRMFVLAVLGLAVAGTIGIEVDKDFAAVLHAGADATAWIAFAAKMVGTALLGWAAWLLFRSVPIKPD